MVRNKLNEYLGIPYFSNVGKHKVMSRNNALVGKGTAKEIALQTIEFANQQNIKLLDLTPTQIYNFQKKNHLGIDCSGLVCHLLGLKVDVRKISANMLTSLPISKQIKTLKSNDLIRQKNGHHVLLVLSVDKDLVTYVHSSLSKHGVIIETKNIKDIPNDSFWRVTSLPPKSGT
ncbi:hypothetical protein CO009_02575 [Candidatus Shapirobacteria bacterium CG_4_8_14_3_um_filter_35_11]|uniref:NlpC/P60 domain-containing protein n=6 Tax=Candidatus Shapironibacteriota TaxID=1752721 RepID=A0A1J5I4Q4_9BACT|nr:MAG: hypothetical protein AUK05_01455 [Candidatus Shapirobacteria bacterium CG2_30_35_20]PIV07513.1 MAG: hypothetical protein COS53_02085 [Candidatus Shapirobacteria bacterium CG03_land_8_20_14_0_80_35_14]PIX68252.1 MAG: hypothetical protein COZ41_00730 [Candidatus Shapirobacteria bacterium CG_4_10_14_3_um_filter_35_13]PJA50756.1 MAG: hypothetical protein CO168_03415 [Candidatus Shapirobacteria bacterium CG_4_9_14_3_um_filter_36_12]PJC80223.1 MAG: hypothetical protein CO009_02575 [Candidatus